MIPTITLVLGLGASIHLCEIVRDFQSVIGREAANNSTVTLTGRDLPDALVACVGGGRMPSGLPNPFAVFICSYVWG